MEVLRIARKILEVADRGLVEWTPVGMSPTQCREQGPAGILGSRSSTKVNRGQQIGFSAVRKSGDNRFEKIVFEGNAQVMERRAATDDKLPAVRVLDRNRTSAIDVQTEFTASQSP
jgi:hypothetical protein